LKARELNMGAPILHTLAQPAHSLRPLLLGNLHGGGIFMV